jgi:hypothetical protein
METTMQVGDLMTNHIRTLDTDKLIADIVARLSTYPKNSLSAREVVESVNLGEMSYEEAMKIADSLNKEVTNTIQNFTAKMSKGKAKLK